MKRTMCVAALLVLSLAGCKTVDKGTVIHKEFDPSYTVIQQTCVMYDPKTSLCQFYTYTPITYPDNYLLELRDDTENQPEKDRDTGWVSVPPADYERYHIGDQYP